MKGIFYILIASFLTFYKTGWSQTETSSKALTKVPIWGIFEKKIKNDISYSDPFRDVDLNVRYFSPLGDTIEFWGFYDDGNTWRYRIMPDITGIWRYEAAFSDGTPAGKGSFNVVDSNLPGIPVQDVANRSWLGFSSGKHVIIRGFHVGDRFFASNWATEKRTEFLDWAVEQGYNLMSIASFFLNRNVEGRGKGWDTPDLWDDKKKIPNPREYSKAESIIEDLARREIIIFPFSGFFGQSSDFPVDPDDQLLYLRYTIARFGAYWNMLLNIAGPEPLWRPDAFRNQMPASRIIELGNRIQALNPNEHLISIHNETGPDPFRHENWLGYMTLQGGKEDPGPEVYQYIAKHSQLNKPVFAQEVFWPGNMYHSCDCDKTLTIRQKAFLLLFAGATINFADMDGNSSSGFSGSLDLNDRHQEWHDAIKRVWDWFETMPFYRMKPERRMAENGFALAENGVRYFVYILNADQRVKLDLTAATGSYNLRWYDPVKDKYTSSSTVIEGNNEVILSSPPGNKNQDWIAILERTDMYDFTNENGLISIEAEHATASKGWREVDGRSGKAMRDEGKRGEGFMSYPVKFDKSGKYYVYMLMRRTDPEDPGKANDAFVYIGDRKLFASDGKTRPDGIRCSKMEFSWESMPKGPGAHTPRHIFNDPVYAYIPAAGEYTLKIVSRSVGIEIDKILITPDKIRPEGIGPAETVNKMIKY